ncbi:hypothetical protein VT48_01655 [Bacillus altitudinis]|nr:hypothetical protein VT48_01655 [Bacillus altitudinis]
MTSPEDGEVSGCRENLDSFIFFLNFPYPNFIIEIQHQSVKDLSDRRIFGVIAHRRFHRTRGNSSIILNMIITYAQMVKSYHVRQLTEKVIGTINQTLKNAFLVLSLKVVQDRKIIKK